MLGLGLSAGTRCAAQPGLGLGLGLAFGVAKCRAACSGAASSSSSEVVAASAAAAAPSQWPSIGSRPSRARRCTASAAGEAAASLAIADAAAAAAVETGPFGRLPGSPALALGKFDALHVGHKALADRARALGHEPWLLSFSGMAEVLGWPQRLPLVAPEHRPALLRSWGDVRERVLPFQEVRQLSPEQFVDLLADTLGARAVVCGSNFRFGYRAAGDTEALQRLGREKGLTVAIEDLVPAADTDGTNPAQVSSSAVREALSAGDVARAAQLLGRPHSVCFRRASPTAATAAATAAAAAAATAAAPRPSAGGDEEELHVEFTEPANFLPGPGRYLVSVAFSGAAAARGNLEIPLGGDGSGNSNGVARLRLRLRQWGEARPAPTATADVTFDGGAAAAAGRHCR